MKVVRRPVVGRRHDSVTATDTEIDALSLAGVSHRFISAGRQQISLSVPRGTVHAVVGPSGSGKTTLFRIIRGLETAEQGSVLIGEHRVTGEERAARASLRLRAIGAVQQSPDLLPELSAVENVELPMIFEKERRGSARERALEMLALVGLADFSDRDIATLSGGEQQRVAVARSLVRPELTLILADEPTASLDRDNAVRVFRALEAAARERRVGCFLATHDPYIADLCAEVREIGAAA